MPTSEFAVVLCKCNLLFALLVPMPTLPFPNTVSLSIEFVFKTTFVFPFDFIDIGCVALVSEPKANTLSYVIPIPWESFGCLNIAIYYYLTHKLAI